MCSTARDRGFEEVGNLEHQYNYAIQKLTEAMECLATHPGDIRRRLTRAFEILAPVTTDRVPPECRDDWSWILQQMVRFGPVFDGDGQIVSGALENTMSRIRNHTGSKIAMRILELYWSMSHNTKYE
jgi:hypothetical protein